MMHGSWLSRGPGMRAFLNLVIGQLVSSFGSALTGFALAIWVLQGTGSVTLFSMIVLAGSVPVVLLSPLAGVLADRYDRRKIMLLCEGGAAGVTLLAAALAWFDLLAVWNVVILVICGALSNTFLSPAFTASIPVLVPKNELGRASGLTQLGQGLATALAPAIAGGLMPLVGVGPILLIDSVTFLASMILVASIRIPRVPVETSRAEQGRPSMLDDVIEGWRHLRVRSGLVGLLAVFAVGSFVLPLVSLLFAPLVLSMSTPGVLGATFSACGVGMILGTLVVLKRGVPQRKVRAMLGLTVLAGLAVMLVGITRSALVLAGLVFATMLVLPLARGAEQVIWQTKVALGYQGRVFALRRTLMTALSPLAFVIAGPLADLVFQPLLDEGGALAGTVGRWIGVGPGRGYGLMFVLCGLALTIIAAASYAQPRIRNLESELPDVVEEVPDIPPPTHGIMSVAGERS